MRDFDNWMHRHFSIELSPVQEQAIDDFAGAVGFTVQEHAGTISLAIMGTIIGLALIAAVL